MAQGTARHIYKETALMEPRSADYSPFKRVILFGVTAFLTLIVFIPLIAEASLRILNLVYPLERPYALRDELSNMLQVSE